MNRWGHHPRHDGPLRFLTLSFRARCPLSPREAHRVHLLVASPMAAGFGFFGSVATSISVTRPNRVHLRCGSRVWLTRLRRTELPLHSARLPTWWTSKYHVNYLSSW